MAPEVTFIAQDDSMSIYQDRMIVSGKSRKNCLRREILEIFRDPVPFSLVTDIITILLARYQTSYQADKPGEKEGQKKTERESVGASGGEERFPNAVHQEHVCPEE